MNGRRRLRSSNPRPNHALLAIRESLGLSQRKFGKPAGLGQSTIARLESGKTLMTMEHAERLGRAWGRDLRTFFPSDKELAKDEVEAALAARASRVARRLGRLVDDNDQLVDLIAGLVFALLDHQRRGHEISDDDDTLSRVEAVLQNFKLGRR